MRKGTGDEREQGGIGRWARRHAPSLRAVAVAVIVLGLASIARTLPIGPMVESLSGWVRGLGAWGPAVFVLIYVVAVVALLPASALTIAAGAIFGLATGTIVVSIGSTIGAALAFLIARHLARDVVARRVRRYPRFEAIDRAVGSGGWKIVALLRLSPAVPFNLQNYLYGLTRIGFWPCVLTSWAAMLPGTLMYVYLGHAGRAGLEAASGGRTRSPAEWALLGVGLAATVVVTVYVTRMARKALREQSTLTSDPPDSPGSGSEPMPSSTRGTAILGGIALVVLALAGYVQARPGAIERLLLRLAGPPRVVLREAYPASPSGPHLDHSELDGLLRMHVSEGGWVDYVGLKRDAGRLDSYLRRVGDAPFDAMGRDEKLALLINAYNAFTLKLIVEHYPIDSIRSIPSGERWDAKRWKVGPYTWSLNQIENEQIRPRFREPRIHFALVCAAVGCPPLRSEAYAADRIDEQLEDQARYIHTHDRWFRTDGKLATVWLTALYKWYSGDFEQVAGSAIAYAARYVPGLRDALGSGRRPEVRWLDYDWSLNAIENRPGDER